MRDDHTIEKNKIKVGLLGASFDTGNLGVSALAESTVKIILHKWPNAEVILVGSGYTPQEYHSTINQEHACLKTVPIRFSKNIFLPYHFIWFTWDAMLMKILPDSSLKKTLAKRNPYFQTLYELDFVADITGGDSFSDIYGMRRFVLGFLHKWLVIFLGKKIIFLPQTYGPFKRKSARMMAKYILKRASRIYSRDQESLDYVNHLFKNHNKNEKIRFAPDVAFILDSREPEHLDVGSLYLTRKNDSIVIGVNISGLLYTGGYTGNNMFELRTNYAQLVFEIIESLLQEDNKRLILLVPHVFPPPGYDMESDTNACLKVYEQLDEKYHDRIFLVRGQYNQNEIKHIIGTCDFFLGSRMHSCIAALSQYIPAVGIAYSKKFKGVFESVGMGDYVADARSLSKEQVLNIIESALKQRDKIRKLLEQTIPNIKKDIFDIFYQNI
jgi:colanic acid/amylovoran biosynthesis protein